MARDEGNKVHREMINTGIDRINSLPDDIKAHILSFLSTKKAVQACILSKRWHDVWAHFPVLKVSQYEFSTPDRSGLDKFIRFVNGVLENRKTSHLEVFECYCCKVDTDKHFVEWLDRVAALMPRVIVFDANIPRHFDLPESVFSCASLQNLKLHLTVYGNIIRPKSINLPSLKVLELISVEVNDDFAQKLFSGCPALESLVLRWCDLRISDITSDILMMLNVDHCWVTKKMLISCPRLVYLSIRSRTVNINTEISFKNMTSLATADIMLHNNYYDPSILSSLTNATAVKLHGSLHSMKQLVMDILKCGIFNNLRMLEIGEWDMTTNFDLVACFLKNSPNLGKLYLQLGRLGDRQRQPRHEAKRILCKLEYVELVKITGGNKVQSDKLVKILRRHIKNIGHLLIL